MRCLWPFLVGIAVLGCKDKPAATPTEQASPAGKPAPPSTPEPAAPRAPAPPTLAQDFDSETENKAWADAQEQAIRAVAPDVTDVVCREQQCRVSLSAPTMDELVAKTEKLQREDSLRSTGAKSILLSAPANGTIQIYVRYDR